MIQKIVKDSDIKFNVSEDSKIQDKFIIKFYTVNKSNAITKTAENVIEENEKRYIKLNWSELRHLENGMINYEVNNLDSDADYNDGVYNSTFTRTTYYYLYSESNSGGGAGSEEIEQLEQKADQIITDLNKEKEDRAQGDTNLTNTITENDNQYQGRFERYDRRFTFYSNRIQGLDDRLLALEFGPRVSALETNTQDLNNRFDKANSQAEDLNNRYEYLGGWHYAEFKRDMSDLEQKVSALETGTRDLKESMSVVEPNNNNNRVSVVEPNNYNNRVSALETDNGSLEDRVSALETDNGSLEDRVSALETEYNNYNNRVSALEKKIETFVASFPTDTKATDIKQKVTELTDRVTALETGTQDIQNSLPVVETDNDSLVNRMSSVVETGNDGIANQSLTLEERVSALETEYSGYDNKLFTPEHLVDDTLSYWPPEETSYEKIQQRVSTLENRIKALESK